MGSDKSDVLQGTLDLMVLKTLESMGPLHGYGIALSIKRISDEVLQVEEGSLYPALSRLETNGSVPVTESTGGPSAPPIPPTGSLSGLILDRLGPVSPRSSYPPFFGKTYQ